MPYAYTMAAEYKVAESAVNCICLIIGRLDPGRADSFNSPALQGASTSAGSDRTGEWHPQRRRDVLAQTSLNLIDACEPSQNGLFWDAPHRQSVTRFRTS
jgi:hypothetical protein